MIDRTGYDLRTPEGLKTGRILFLFCFSSSSSSPFLPLLGTGSCLGYLLIVSPSRLVGLKGGFKLPSASFFFALAAAKFLALSLSEKIHRLVVENIP